jgi:hypothetical protein
MASFKYDIAISLCKQDVDFARQLIAQINPSLKLFFYEDNQDEIITKSGPEVFGRIFKEESRVVVILSRTEWSESLYTDIEKNAIIDRTSVKNQGYQFLLVIPMEPGQIPSWYPSTKIYSDPRRFTIEELAKFIEFKVSEEGGVIKPITLEEQYEHLLERIEQKKALVAIQETQPGIDAAQSEIKALKGSFNKKLKLLQEGFFDGINWHPFTDHQDRGHFGIGDFQLSCQILKPDRLRHKVVTTQDIGVRFELVKLYGNESKKLEEETRVYYYSLSRIGWALQYLHERASQNEMLVLFRNTNNQYYDLKDPLHSDSLVDEWFQKLLTHASCNIEKYL